MSDLAMIQQLCTMLSSMLTEARAITEANVVEAAILLAITWSLGGALVAAGRLQFDKVRPRRSEPAPPWAIRQMTADDDR